MIGLKEFKQLNTHTTKEETKLLVYILRDKIRKFIETDDFSTFDGLFDEGIFIESAKKSKDYITQTEFYTFVFRFEADAALTSCCEVAKASVPRYALNILREPSSSDKIYFVFDVEEKEVIQMDPHELICGSF